MVEVPLDSGSGPTSNVVVVVEAGAPPKLCVKKSEASMSIYGSGASCTDILT